MLTADVILFNGFNKKEVRIKALFDGGSQRSYVSKRVQNILSSEIINKEKIKINTFNNNNSKEEIRDYVKFFVKTGKGNKSIEAFSISLICLPLKNHKICSTKLPASQKFEFCRFRNRIRRNGSTDRFRLFMGICIWEGEM